jgi:plasmid stabilization system protein ParE
MTYPIKILPQALAEIQEAYQWMESTIGLDIAVKWYHELLLSVRSLEQMPQRCSLAPEGGQFDKEIRQLLVGKKRTYRVLFTVEDSTVYIRYLF